MDPVTRRAALAALLAIASTAHAADARAEHVTVIDLVHMPVAMQAMFDNNKHVPIPRLLAFDKDRHLIIAEIGYHKTVEKELHQALSRDRALASPITLEMVLSETVDPHGAPLTVDKLPPADLYVVDYWAEWCGPCHLLSRTLTDTLDHWSGIHSVWIKIESDPRKQRG